MRLSRFSRSLRKKLVEEIGRERRRVWLIKSLDVSILDGWATTLWRHETWRESSNFVSSNCHITAQNTLPISTQRKFNTWTQVTGKKTNDSLNAASHFLIASMQSCTAGWKAAKVENIMCTLWVEKKCTAKFSFNWPTCFASFSHNFLFLISLSLRWMRTWKLAKVLVFHSSRCKETFFFQVSATLVIYLGHLVASNWDW